MNNTLSKIEELAKLAPPRKIKPRKTRRQHGTKPPGMKCWASRPNGLLVLEFEDGEVIELEGRFYAEGWEEPWLNGPQTIMEAMDREVLEDLQRVFDQEAGPGLPARPSVLHVAGAIADSLPGRRGGMRSRRLL